MDILVFKMNCNAVNNELQFDSGYKLKIWKPGMFRYLPPQMDSKYFAYWCFHFLKIFKNRNYGSYLLYDNDELVSSCLVVPYHYKWPFMDKNDVQFTFVMTNSKYKGRRIAGKLIGMIIASLNRKIENFWYVTDTENPASIRVAEKIGFQFYGKAERKGIMNILEIK